MTSSLTSYVAMAPQSAKDTPASALFSGRFLMSGGGPTYDYIETANEHFRGIASRATTRKTIAQRSSYIVPFAAQGNFYPIMIGAMLRGIGFGVVTTGTTVYTHTFTIGARSAIPWITAMMGRGDGGTQWDRRLVNGRLETLQIGGGPKGLTCAFSGSALEEGDPGGAETFIDEVGELFVPSVGSATITIDGNAFTSPVRALQLQVSNQLDKNEQRLFAFERGDLQNVGMDVSLQLGAIDVDSALYGYFHQNNATTDAPAPAAVRGAIDFTFNSANDITGQAEPYGFQVTIPSLEMRIGPIQSRRIELIRTNLVGLMVDDVATPMTVVLTNNRATY